MTDRCLSIRTVILVLGLLSGFGASQALGQSIYCAIHTDTVVRYDLIKMDPTDSSFYYVPVQKGKKDSVQPWVIIRASTKRRIRERTVSSKFAMINDYDILDTGSIAVIGQPFPDSTAQDSLLSAPITLSIQKYVAEGKVELAQVLPMKGNPAQFRFDANHFVVADDGNGNISYRSADGADYFQLKVNPPLAHDFSKTFKVDNTLYVIDREIGNDGKSTCRLYSRAGNTVYEEPHAKGADSMIHYAGNNFLFRVNGEFRVFNGKTKLASEPFQKFQRLGTDTFLIFQNSTLLWKVLVPDLSTRDICRTIADSTATFHYFGGDHPVLLIADGMDSLAIYNFQSCGDQPFKIKINKKTVFFPITRSGEHLFLLRKDGSNILAKVRIDMDSSDRKFQLKLLKTSVLTPTSVPLSVVPTSDNSFIAMVRNPATAHTSASLISFASPVELDEVIITQNAWSMHTFYRGDRFLAFQTEGGLRLYDVKKSHTITLPPKITSIDRIQRPPAGSCSGNFYFTYTDSSSGHRPYRTEQIKFK